MKKVILSAAALMFGAVAFAQTSTQAYSVNSSSSNL